MASLTQWTWAWADSGRWWRTGKPGMLHLCGCKESNRTEIEQQGFVGGASDKEPAFNAEDIADAGLIPGLGRSLGGGQGNPLQFGCLDNPMDTGAWQATVHWVAKNWTWLKPLLPAMWEIQFLSLGQEDPLEKEMATQSSILAWRIPWTEEPGGLQSTGSQRVGHDWATSLHFTSKPLRLHGYMQPKYTNVDILWKYHVQPLFHNTCQCVFLTWTLLISEHRKPS